MLPDADSQKLSERETERRREEALKRMLNTPHKPHADQKPSPRKGASAKQKPTHKS